ncbi:MAG TPA: hypothetical protein VF444_17035 [Pseudonocardiaceae bacterium]
MLPLVIKEAHWIEPSLTLSLVGNGWAFGSISAWRVLKGDVLEFSYSTVEASDLILNLCGLSIVSVTSQSPRMAGDPAFELSDGRWLEIFSDIAVDPWVMSLPDFGFVGAPGDSRYTQD